MARTSERGPGSGIGLPSWAVVTPDRRAHVERVAALLEGWAGALALPRSTRARWLRAAWLHDALRDADFSDPLAHGPAAADRAADDGERDQGVLDAVRYHSIGWSRWDDVGRALYCADYLEPGRDYHDASLASLARAFVSDSQGTLREVARRRVSHSVLAGHALQAETVEFWNTLCDAG